MKFVEHHLTRHHLFHTPHKWFLAFLISPLHAAEMHYKQKYHLTFAHAKKLFFFDMLLLLSTLFLLGSTIFWYTYDPTVVELVSISISSNGERIQSGEFATYTVRYENNSDVLLTDVRLSLALPEGFEQEEITPQNGWVDGTLPLSDMAPGGSGEITFSGWFYDVPHEHNTIAATFSYIQDGEKTREVKARHALTTLRGSVLDTTIETHTHILGTGTTPILIRLHNTGERPLSSLTLPLPVGELSIHEVQPSKGTIIEGNSWTLPSLEADETVTLTGILHSAIPPAKKQTTLSLTPKIEVNSIVISQSTYTKELTVSHPQVTFTIHEAEYTSGISPGNDLAARIAIENSGDVTLEHLYIDIPLHGGVINAPLFIQKNTGTGTSDQFRITEQHHAALRSLAPGATVTLPITIPIAYAPPGTDILLSVTPQLSATVQHIPNATFESRTATPIEVPVGSQLILTPSARYYTDEGDQLGRGPLPPRIGKETKYWAIIELNNTSSELQQLALTAHVPEHIVWTGKTSVSAGANIVFDERTRILSWKLNTMHPHQTVGIYTELSFTPTEAHRGTTPLLLDTIRASATDAFIGASLIRTATSIDTSLPKDTRAIQQGVSITQ